MSDAVPGPAGPTRFVRMPGPPRAERATTARCGSIPIDAALPAGVSLLDALHELVARHGCESACLTLRGGALFPFAYVIPALSKDASHAAFYSGVMRPPDPSALDVAAVTVGFREGAPFFHCHALWREPDGRLACGHVLPDETEIERPIHARGAGIVGARFDATPDPETGFSLFMPRATGTPVPTAARPALALRLAPNQELAAALERAGREAGFADAIVQGGVASIIEARFLDAEPLGGFATELLVRQGRVGCAGGETTLDVSVVDYRGDIREGRLVPGDNPVLMTFEGLLEQA